MLLVAFLHTLEAIVQTIFFVIFEIGLGNRVSACQIDLGCRDCTASVLFQRVRIVCGSEFEVIALIVLSIGFGIAEGWRLCRYGRRLYKHYAELYGRWCGRRLRHTDLFSGKGRLPEQHR